MKKWDIDTVFLSIFNLEERNWETKFGLLNNY